MHDRRWLAMLAVHLVVGVCAGRVIGREFDVLLVGVATTSVAVGGLAGRSVMSGHRALVGVTVLLLFTFAVSAGCAASRGGSVRDLPLLRNGWSVILSTPWPSPQRPEVLAILGTGSAIAGWLAGWATAAKQRVVALVPGLCAIAITFPVTAEAGRLPALWITLMAVAVLGYLAATAPGAGSKAAPLSWRNASTAVRRLAQGLVALGALGVATVGDGGARADARRPGVQSSALAVTDPLATTAAMRSLSPAQPLMTVDKATTSLLRFYAVDRFDGATWSSSAALYQLGATAPDGDHSTTTVTFLSDRIAWVPSTASIRSVSADSHGPKDRSFALLDAPPRPGDSITIVEQLSAISDVATVTRTDGGSNSDIARQLSQARSAVLPEPQGTLHDQLRSIEGTLRDDYAVDMLTVPSASPGLLRTMVETTKVGAPEQYAAAFVLLAQSMGAEARLAVGVTVPSSAGGVVTITTAHAAVWPEVHLDGVGWVAFDPVPRRRSTIDETTTFSSTGPRVVAPPASQVVAAVASEQPTQQESLSGPDARSLAVRNAIRSVVLGIAGACGCGALWLALIVGRKSRRRARYRNSEGRDAAMAAWRSVRDMFVDIGHPAPHHLTNLEIAEGFAAQPGAAPTVLARLASSATIAGFSPVSFSVADGQQLWADADRVRRAVLAELPRQQRLRTRLSARSLRTSRCD
jgi:hypothetical protein